MVDPDDVEYFRLSWRLDGLLRLSRRLAEPELGPARWLELVVALLRTSAASGVSLEGVMLAAADRVIAELHDAL